MGYHGLISATAVALAASGMLAQAGEIVEGVEAKPLEIVKVLVNAGAAGLLLLCVYLFLRRDRERDTQMDQRDAARDLAVAVRERERDDQQERLFASYEKQVEKFQTQTDNNTRELIKLNREVIEVVQGVKTAVSALERVVYHHFPKIEGDVTRVGIAMDIQPKPAGSHRLENRDD